MGSVKALTGGTNDVNPQPLRVRVTQASNNNAASIAVPIPVQRLTTGGRAQVLEILKIVYDCSATSSAAITSARYTVCLSSRSQNTTTPSYGNADPYTIYYASRPFSLDSGPGFAVVDTREIEMTDGAGHGILYGQDTLYLQYSSSSSGGTWASGTLNCNIYYRWKNVGFSEYVGMVTAQ